MSWIDKIGFDVRKLSHMKRDVKPRVKVKLKQHRKQPVPPEWWL